MTQIREPAVAGSFYPAGGGELGRTVRAMLREAQAPAGPAPKALIVPHAGYVYSGGVAAAAYARLEAWRDRFTRVVLLGPSHHMAWPRLAVSGAAAFRTPLGDVPVDREAAAGLKALGVVVSEAPHRVEHSLEVQLPFLQAALDAFSLLPLAVGDADPEAVAEVIDHLWGGPETLFVVSSDLSHFLAYGAAQRRDEATCRAIEAMDIGRIGAHDACGSRPVKGLLLAARRRGMRVTTLDLRNSGDTAGDRSRVVGYGAWMFLEEAP